VGVGIGIENEEVSTMSSSAGHLAVDRVTETVIGCAFRVHNTLGTGFLEKVYENALAHEVRKSGLVVAQQAEINVYYDEVQVGRFAADLLVDSSVLVELKAVKALDEIHLAQCINYLRATGLGICLLMNFGRPRLEYERVVLG
jgi:GxxExxY protein